MSKGYYNCDRCKKFFKPNNEDLVELTLANKAGYLDIGSGNDWDLCPNCIKTLKTWLSAYETPCEGGTK